MTLILALLGGYLLGSVPFGLVIARTLGLGDLRQIGSGNIGATNVLRTGHKGAALATLLLDSGKGAIAVLLALWVLGPGTASALAGLGAFLGHLYPVWLRFQGGKGVATYLGILLAIAPVAGVLTCGTWLVAAVIGRMSSLAALVAALAAPVWLLITDAGQAVLPTFVMTLLIFWKHRENIVRIRTGTESRINLTGRKDPDDITKP